MKYKASANLIWSVEGDTQEEAKQKAEEYLLNLIIDSPFQVSKINMNPMKEKAKIKRLGEFKPEDVFAFIGPGRKIYQADGESFKVKMNSHRYHLFVKQKNCVACGLEGTKMFLELSPGSEFPHFNFYAIEGEEEILMTKDHKIPKALGGKDSLDNYQTMCVICNAIKGANQFTLDEIKVLRNVQSRAKSVG